LATGGGGDGLERRKQHLRIFAGTGWQRQTSRRFRCRNVLRRQMTRMIRESLPAEQFGAEWRFLTV
jgi:hypothetical protein